MEEIGGTLPPELINNLGCLLFINGQHAGAQVCPHARERLLMDAWFCTLLSVRLFVLG